MTAGDGIARVYSSTGQLINEDRFKDNKREEFSFEKLNDVFDLTRFKNGIISGTGYQFFHNGELALITFFSPGGQPTGPFVRFSRPGTISEKKWFVDGKEVAEDAYEKEAANRKDLPVYNKDTAKYKDLVEKDAKSFIEEYLKMPRVKIPLQFDGEGNPIPAK